MATEMRFEDRMSDMDALMWQIEKDPMLRSTITAISVLDRAPDHTVLMDKIERATRIIPRLRQRVVGNPFSMAPPRWEVDPNFDLAYHVRSVRSAGDGTMRDLLDLAEPVAMQGFDRARPQWEFVLVEGLEHGRAALIQKLHHAITDGVGGVKMAMMLLDLEREPSGDDDPMPHEPEAHPLSAMGRLWDGIGHVQRRQQTAARNSLHTALGGAAAFVGDPMGSLDEMRHSAESVGRMLSPATHPMSPIMGHRSLSVRFNTFASSLPGLKAAAKLVDGKLNDAFVAAVLGGLARYHEAHGAPVDQLRMTMPINIRDESTEDLAGNQFAPARFAVPLDHVDPVVRMKAVKDLVAEQRAEPALALAEPLASVLTRLPTTVTTAIFGSMLKGIDFVTSNVPGAPVAVFMAGAEVTKMIAMAPLSGSGANITLLSHIDDVHIGINTDRAAVPDDETFVACLAEGFDEIQALA